MAEHAKRHLWLNTVIAGVALSATVALTITSYREYQLKAESIGLAASLFLECPLGFQDSEQARYVTLCWKVEAANQSENRISIVKQRIVRMLDDGLELFNPGDVMEVDDERSLSMPLILDRGEVHTYTLRTNVGAPTELTQIARRLSDGKISPQIESQEVTLRSLELVALNHDLDLLGNNLVRRKTPTGLSWTPARDAKAYVAEFRVLTGRGNVFAARLIYPDRSFRSSHWAGP